MKRDDFENFDELIETAEDEDAAGVYSSKIKLFDGEDKRVASPGQNQGGPDLHSHLHSFEEEASYYDS